MPHETSMSAASRKAWNLKVIQRHDPDILCIWDQVSYVMLMQYSPTGWTKTAVEGSLFLFDRRGLPRYGFFILNRSSSQNYMHLLTSEDNLEVQESYVIFRAKGSKDAPVLGLWAGDPDHRKHLGDTLSGLHAHIKSGSSAPFYDPATVFSPGAESSPEALTQGNMSPGNYPPPTNPSNNASSLGASTGIQSLNDLFARLSSSASTNTVTPAMPDTSRSPFHVATAPAPSTTSKQTKSSFSPPPSAASSAGPLRGQALLDSLFAMASPAPTPAAPQPVAPANSSFFGSHVASQVPSGSGNPIAPGSAPQPQTVTQAPAPTGGDLLAQLFANINNTQTPTVPPMSQTKTTGHSRQPSTPPSIAALPADPAIIHSTKVTPDPPRHDKRRNNIRRGGYATDTSPRSLHTHAHNRLSVFDEDAAGHSRNASLTGDEALTLNGSTRSKPRVGRALVPFQSDTGPEYHPDPTRPHVSSRYPTGMNGEEERVHAMGGGIEEEAEDEIFYDGRGGKGPSPRRQKRRQKNGRGSTNGNGNGRQGEGANLDRQMAGEVLMQGIEWDDGVVDKDLFLQSIYALLSEQEFVDQLYNDYKIAQTRQA